MVGVALLVFCLVAVGFVFFCCVSAWWNRGIADEVTMASYGRAVTGTAVMARSANEEKKKNGSVVRLWVMSYLGEMNGFRVPRGGV